MIAALRRLFGRHKGEKRLSPVEKLTSDMRQQMQIAKLEEYRFQRRRERGSGNPIEETVFPPRHWPGGSEA